MWSSLNPIFLLSLLVFSSAFPITLPTITFERRSVASVTDNLLYSVSLSTFLAAKAARNPSYLDWTDDGCSSSPDKPSGYNFLDSCKRHDFGYRNYKKQSRFTETNRARIDQNFKDDLYRECAKYSGWQSYKGVICRGIADTYYNAVRTFGGSGDHIPFIPGV